VDALKTVEVTPGALRTIADSFLEQNRVMKGRVTAMCFIIGGLLVGGAFWYIGALDPWIQTNARITADVNERVAAASSIADLVRRLGAVVMMIFLVRIFVPLLRYAAELEIFYRSRAAALQILADGRAEKDTVRLNVQTLIDLVSSDKIKLAAAPESPIAELVATVRAPEKVAAMEKQG
jgi:hypothetical protein